MSRTRSRKKRSSRAADAATPTSLREVNASDDAVSANAVAPEHDAAEQPAASADAPRALFEVRAPTQTSEPAEPPVTPTPGRAAEDTALPAATPDAASAADRAGDDPAAGGEIDTHEPRDASGPIDGSLDRNASGAAPQAFREPTPQPAAPETLSPPQWAATVAAAPERAATKRSAGGRKMAARELVESDAPAAGTPPSAHAARGPAAIPDDLPRADSAESGGTTRAREIGGALRSHWMIIIGTALAVTLVAWLVVAMQPSRYRAETIVAVAPTGTAAEAHEIYRGVEVLQYRTVVATIAALASTAIDPASVPGAGAAADYGIRAVVLPHTDLLRLEVEGPDPRRATAIANQLPALLSQRTQAMYKFYGITPVSPAAVPTEPFSPRVGRAIAAGLLGGLALGAALAYALHRFRSAAA